VRGKVGILTSMIITGTMIATTVGSAPALAVTDVGDTITRGEVIDRAQYWLDRGDTWYSQQQSDAKPDGDGHDYRPDCSGFVAMVWHMPKKSDGWDLNTDDFHATTQVSDVALNDLKAGDAILTDGHIELFDKWVDASDHSDGIWTYGEHDYGRKTEHNTMTWSYLTANFEGIRYKKIVDSTPRPYDSFTGDAAADLVVHAGTDVSVRTNFGGGFDSGSVVSSGWGLFHGKQVDGDLGRLYFADFNGDHRTDMIVHNGTDISVRLNTGSVFDGGRSVSSGWGSFHGLEVPGNLGRLYFADFNGDGRADMFVHSGTDLSVRLNTGSGFDGGRSVSTGWGLFHGKQVAGDLGRLYFADYNGDGRDDLIVHNGSDLSVRLNTGSGFDGGRSVSSGWGLFHGLDVAGNLGRLYFADYNGDGRDDLIVHSGTDISVRLNTGSGFDGGRSVSTGWGLFHGEQIPGDLGRLYFA
jgi:VCBS repeat protein